MKKKEAEGAETEGAGDAAATPERGEDAAAAAPAGAAVRTAVPTRVREGIVIKNRMQKTVVVEVSRRVTHSKYLKQVKRRLRYAAHDAAGACGVGDVVMIEETRPLSKSKRWRVKEILKKAVEI